jgi:glycine cleavage system transcriptional repressor
MLGSMRLFALSAIGRDRPGIVSAVSEALLAHHANVEDSQMAILRGHFTMTLIVSVPETTDLDRLRADLDPVRKKLDLEGLAVSEIEQLDAKREPEPSHILSVYGLDHPGILHSIASVLAGEQVNITDLSTRVLEEEGETPLYAMVLEVAVPDACDPASLEAKLRAACDEQKVELSFRELEQDVL